jgi:hypothetical protein
MLRALVRKWRLTALRDRSARFLPGLSQSAAAWYKGRARGLEDAADDLAELVGEPPDDEDLNGHRTSG